jgi:hypothetical protein
MSDFYILEYSDADPGCPVYLAAELNHEQTEWNIFEPRPFDVEVKNDYVLQITDKTIRDVDFDMEGRHGKYVSRQFLDVCQSLGVSFRAIPLTILLPNKKKTRKEYFFFLPCDYLMLMDRSSSVFVEDIDPETNRPKRNKLFPFSPVYNRIDSFVPIAGETPELFCCLENMELVCTEKFKQEAEKNRLLGIRYVPIDSSYKYDPWAGW